MTLIAWRDAAYAPSLAQAQAAYAQGYRACGFYLGPTDADEDPLNTWSAAQVQTLRQASLLPVPIIVPTPSLASDPVDAANEAMTNAQLCGLSPKVSILYDGNHLTTTGQITGPVWLPIPGPMPTAVGSQSAIQWNTVSINGWSVDLSVAAPDFPFDKGIVVDFEYNTAAGGVGINWYHAFQSRIAQLGTFTPPPPPPGVHHMRNALPASALPVKEITQGNSRPGQWDVILLGADGHAYHLWYDAGAGWLGPEDLTKAG